MTNDEKFFKTFGYYASDIWIKSEDEFLEWLSLEAIKPKNCPNIVLLMDKFENDLRINSMKQHKKWVDFFKENKYNDYVIWTCPHCGKILKFSSKEELPIEKFCPHCGEQVLEEKENDMSIYAEYAHGVIDEDEFRQAVRDEEWLDKVREAESYSDYDREDE